MTSSIPFPTAALGHQFRGSVSKSITNLSVISSRHATAIEVCDYVYGNTDCHPDIDVVHRFYETNASEHYENPFLTATSREVLSDIHTLSRKLSHVNVPRPLAMFCTLFGLRQPDSDSAQDNVLFRALRIWTDLGDISESESFDGHRKCIVEHTLNILLLPGIHTDRHRCPPVRTMVDSDAASVLTVSTRSSTPLLTTAPGAHHYHAPYPPPTRTAGLAVPLTGLALPSPLHLQLRVMTRLSFNEQGRITHHRDLWDVRDLLVGLVPGASLAQWIAARLAARATSFVSRMLFGRASSPPVVPPAPNGGGGGGGAATARSRRGSIAYGKGSVLLPHDLFGEGRQDVMDVGPSWA